MTRRPNFFIAGAPRCGTTSLYENLKGHPDIFMSPVKEPRYFAADLGLSAGHDLQFGRDIERYLALFEGAADEKIVGEASVRYIYSAAAPQLIRQFAPDARVLISLRNPVDQLYALHALYVTEGFIAIEDFQEALDTGAIRTDQVRFANRLERWFATFGRDKVYVMLLEDYAADPRSEFRRILQLLDVDPAYEPASYGPRNVNHVPRFKALRRLTRARAPQRLIWDVLPRAIGERRTRSLVRAYRQSAISRRDLPRTPMSAGLRRDLEDDLRADVDELSRLLARDLAALWFKPNDTNRGVAVRGS